VVAEHTKCGRQSLGHVCSQGEVDYLVADDGVRPEWREKLAAAGVELVVAEMGDVETKAER